MSTLISKLAPIASYLGAGTAGVSHVAEPAKRKESSFVRDFRLGSIHRSWIPSDVRDDPNANSTKKIDEESQL